METFVGFDSAWTDNLKAPGSICAVSMEDGKPPRWHPPVLVGFCAARKFIAEVTAGSRYSLIALDQPTVVPNLTSNRPVERLAGSLVGWNGDGTQSSNRGKVGMFCNASPIWRFLSALGATEDPEIARTAEDGLYLVETYPAAALPTLAASSFGYLRALRYNPRSSSKFKLSDWVIVANAARVEAALMKCDHVAAWCAAAAEILHPVKADQDKLDAVICMLVAIRWRLQPREHSAMLGDLATGYMVVPASAEVRGTWRPLRGSNACRLTGWFQLRLADLARRTASCNPTPACQNLCEFKQLVVLTRGKGRLAAAVCSDEQKPKAKNWKEKGRKRTRKVCQPIHNHLHAKPIRIRPRDSCGI